MNLIKYNNILCRILSFLSTLLPVTKYILDELQDQIL